MRSRCIVSRGLRILTIWLGICALLLLGCACSSASQKPPETEPQEVPKPRNAAAIAQSIANGSISILIYAERTREHPISKRLLAMEFWQPILEGTGIDPGKDLSRAFVTAPSVRNANHAVAVLEHTLPPEKVRLGLETLVARSDPQGSFVEGSSVPAVRVTLRGHTRIVAAIEPSFVVILPVDKADQAKRFVGTGGFPDPEGKEVATATALDPSRTLKASRAPRVPKSVRSLKAIMTLAEDGGADVALDGPSSNPEQAQLDAKELTDNIEAATMVKISVLKIRFFDPVEFVAEGDHIKANRHVTPGEIDKIMGLLSAFVQ